MKNKMHKETSVTLEDPTKLNLQRQSFEDTLEAIGGFGAFQVIALMILLFPEIPSAFLLFGPVFVAKLPTSDPCNITILSANGSVEDYLPCDPNFSNNGTLSFSEESTIITEWDLRGDDAWVSDFMNSVQMMGMLTGSIFTSQLSDWSGRKVTYLFVCFLMVIGQVVSALSNSAILYGCARFVGGIGVAGQRTDGHVYCLSPGIPDTKMASALRKRRSVGEGIMLLAVLGYFIRNWRLFILISTIPFIAALALFWIPESPKWLLRNGKLEEARATLKRIAKINGVKNFDLDDASLVLMAEAEMQGSAQSKYTYLSFFKVPALRRKTFVLVGIWFIYSMVYYGLNYNVKNMSGDLYVNMFLMGLSDAIGYPLALLFNNRFGRRKSLILFMGFAAGLLVILAVLDLTCVLDDLAVAGICLLAKIGFGGSRSSMRLLTGESFATPIRTMAFGITGMGAGIGGIIAPQIVFLGTTWWRGLPFVFFAIMSVIGSVLSLTLPETAGKVLQEQMGTKN